MKQPNACCDFVRGWITAGYLSERRVSCYDIEFAPVLDGKEKFGLLTRDGLKAHSVSACAFRRYRYWLHL